MLCPMVTQSRPLAIPWQIPNHLHAKAVRGARASGDVGEWCRLPNLGVVVVEHEISISNELDLACAADD